MKYNNAPIRTRKPAQWWLLLLILPACLLQGCDDNDEGPKKVLADLSVYLPDESSNYPDDTNFVLYDNNGIKCRPLLDTITKGGGTIMYQLSPGRYQYSVRTIFGDTISRFIRVDKSMFLSFYPDVFYKTASIPADSISGAERIDLLIDIYDGAGNANDGDGLRFLKQGHEYFASHNFSGEKGWSIPVAIDSGKLIPALARFQQSIGESNAYDTTVTNNFYPDVSEVYFRCNNNYMEAWDVKPETLAAALAVLKRSIGF